MTQGNDFCNRPQSNFVFQHAADDEGRGVPALGKVVYRTDSNVWEGCVDTDPDPTENGGGTWTALGGSAWTNYTPVLTASSSNPNLGSTGSITGRYTRAGSTCMAVVKAQFGGTGISGGTGFYRVTLPLTQGASALGLLLGYGYVEDQGVNTVQVQAIAQQTSNATQFKMTYDGNLEVSQAQPFVGGWGSGDGFTIFLNYECV